MATIYKLNQINQLAGRNIFFDANVLIYIFWPTGTNGWQSSYSTAYNHLLRQGNQLSLEFRVVSEIINRIHRIEYENHLKRNGIQSKALRYKTYRDSAEGVSVLNDIYVILENDVLPHFEVIGKSFNKDEIMNFLVADYLDFADKAIAQICSENNLVLLTNDIDYSSTSLEVLTSNPNF
ncbi:MAG: hypothetical protein ACK4WD_03120 [Flavobacteriales bacterium]|jgi:predicted nucleic acid-binding protein